MATDGRIYIFLFIGLGAGIFFFIKGFRTQTLYRLIKNLPTSKIRSLAVGLVEIYGSAESVSETQILKSPFSNKDCYYYDYKIQEYRRSGKNSRWVTIKSGRRGVQFYLKDETGRVRVDPTNAKLDIEKDNLFDSSFGRDPPQEVINFCNKIGLRWEGLFGANKRMRFDESFIEPLDKLYILGTARDENPEAGTSEKNEDHLLITKGKNNAAFFISDHSEKDLLSSFKWGMFLQLFGGAGLFVVCLGILLMLFGVN